MSNSSGGSLLAQIVKGAITVGAVAATAIVKSPKLQNLIKGVFKKK